MLWELTLWRLFKERQGGSKHSLVIYIDDNSRKEYFWLGISTAAHAYRNKINPLHIKIILLLQQNKSRTLHRFSHYQVAAQNQVKSAILSE